MGLLDFLPENISTYGGEVDGVIRLIYYVVGVWFVAAELLLFYLIFSGRRKKDVKAGYYPAKTLKSLAVVILPVIVVFGLDLYMEHSQAPVWEKIKINLPENPDMEIGVRAKQFKWEFVHPGKDNKLGTDDDVTELTDLYVPVNKKVVFQLESLDVLHSFWLPNLRLKQDVVPGRKIKGWFEAVKTGKFPIGCAELCGIGHGEMLAWLHVVSDTELNQWYDSKAADKDAW